LEEAPAVRHEDPPEVVDAPSRHPQPVVTVLAELQTQALDVLSEPFFDDAPSIETIPVTKRAASEVGGVRVNAKRRQPYVEATVSVEVKCDRDDAAADSGIYHVRARGTLARVGEGRKVEREFFVPVERDGDAGRLTLDLNELKNEIATAIRSSGESR
jgi:hypothetical protein